MNKQQILSLIRAALSAFGGQLLGKYLLGNAIDQNVYQGILGSLMGAIAMIWSLYDKTATIESIMGIVRQIITFIGGLLVASGRVSAESLTTVLGILTTVLPWLQSHLSVLKNNQLANGTITVADLKK